MKDSCKVNAKLINEIPSCYAKYSASNQDQTSYDSRWQPLNSNTILASPNSIINDAFQYANTPNSYPYAGIVNTYSSGGYMYKMLSNDSQTMRVNLKSLESLNWIDKQTAALFVEFSLYSPNLNLYQYCSILFEITATGSLVNSARFRSVFVPETARDISFSEIMFCAYMLCIVILMVYEIKEIVQLRLVYFTSAFNCLDLFLIGSSWTVCIAYILRLNAVYSVKNTAIRIISKDLISDSTNLNVNLEYASMCNDFLKYCMAFSVALNTICMLKLLRYNKMCIVFMHALRLCLGEIILNGIVFFAYLMSFTQAFYGLFNDKLSQYSTIVRSFQSCVKMILNKETSILFVKNTANASIDDPLGSILFILFFVTVICVFASVFLAIVYNSYTLAASNRHLLYKEDPHVIKYLKLVIGPLFGHQQIDEFTRPKFVYRNIHESFPQKFDELFDRFESVSYIAT